LVVADASVLIVLAKMGRVRLLRLLYEQVIIGPVVKAEVIDKGRVINAPEVSLIEKGVEESWIQEVRPTIKEKRLTQRVLEDTRLHPGEAESLSLACLREVGVLVDDKEARVIAEAMGVERVGTVGVLLEAFVKEHITYEELEKSVRDLGKVMWLSPDVVADVLRTAREVKK
jgi:hypothetical protein